MNYQQTLDFLYTRLPMYQRQGTTAFKKDLTNIRALLSVLGHPERRMGRIVHVAGTNGKGTVSHLIAAALQAHGYQVGLYTSPHYRDFRERMKINGQFIDERRVVDFVARIRPRIERIRPSFFEITVAMAFDFFARSRVQWSVVEVGLGGRLDSTNVVDPVLCVITNIGYDHMDMLGDTLEKIAGEKAGIIKRGRPVIVGLTQPETRGVFESAATRQSAPLFFADTAPATAPQTSLSGPFVQENARTAYRALQQLANDGHLKADKRKIGEGFQDVTKSTYYIGRWQKLGDEPLVIVDSAHNAEGLGPVIKRLKSLGDERNGQLHIVLGMVNDKDLDRVLPLFPKGAGYYFVKADVPRGLPAGELRAAAGTFGMSGQAYESVEIGYRAALSEAGPKDVVFVGGSIFTVAEVL